MNRASIAKRITEAAEQSNRGERAPVMRCWLSDGTVKDMHILETLSYNQGSLVGDEVVYSEPHIERAECIRNRECAPKLVDIVMQMMNGIYED